MHVALAFGVQALGGIVVFVNVVGVVESSSPEHTYHPRKINEPNFWC